MAQKVKDVEPAAATPDDGVALVTVEASGVVVPDTLTKPSAEAVQAVAAEVPPPLPEGILPAQTILGAEEALAMYLDMVTYRRPHQSPGEAEFINKYIMPLNPAIDNFGNFYVHVGKGSQTMFSCHTDTVHRDDKRQKVDYDADMNMVWKNDNQPLGADDATGMWIMLNMIRSAVPGTYLFHRGEECGGLGSGWIAKNDPKWLTQFKRSIAFDRKNIASVITSQNGGVCCSDQFGIALARALNASGCDLRYGLDRGGVFTDTANYVEMIPECTNLSVGYYDEHTEREMQDVEHMQRLLAGCLKVDWEGLPVARKPEAKSWTRFRGSGTGNNLAGLEWDEDLMDWVETPAGKEGGKPVYNTSKSGQSTVSGTANEAESANEAERKDPDLSGAAPTKQTNVSKVVQSTISFKGRIGSTAKPSGEEGSSSDEAAGEPGDSSIVIDIEACLQWIWEEQVAAAEMICDLLDEGIILLEDMPGLAKIQHELNGDRREADRYDPRFAQEPDDDDLSADPVHASILRDLDERVSGMAKDLKSGLILPVDAGRPRRTPDALGPQQIQPVQQPGAVVELQRPKVIPLIAAPFVHHKGVGASIH